MNPWIFAKKLRKYLLTQKFAQIIAHEIAQISSNPKICANNFANKDQKIITPQIFALFFVQIFVFYNFFAKIFYGSYMTHPPNGQRPISLEHPAIDRWRTIGWNEYLIEHSETTSAPDQLLRVTSLVLNIFQIWITISSASHRSDQRNIWIIKSMQNLNVRQKRQMVAWEEEHF